MASRLVLDSWEADQNTIGIIRGVPNVHFFGQDVSAEDLIRMSQSSNSISGPLLAGLAAAASNELPRRTGFAGHPQGDGWI